MAKLENLHQQGIDSIKALECPEFEDQPFTGRLPAEKRKLAIISTAALIRRGELPFRGGDGGYRIIDSSIDDKDLLVSHISVNFDRSAALRNIESVMPRKLAHELVKEGLVNEVSDEHYSFMGSTDPVEMEASATELSGRLASNGVNAVVLLPV